MPHPDSKTQLEALRQQQIELGRKIKEAEAETRRKEREKDERRKLLAGAANGNRGGTFRTFARTLKRASSS